MPGLKGNNSLNAAEGASVCGDGFAGITERTGFGD